MCRSFKMQPIPAGSQSRSTVGQWLMNSIRNGLSLYTRIGQATRKRVNHSAPRLPAAASRWTLAERACCNSARLTLAGDALTDTSVVAVVACGRRMLASHAERLILDLRGVRQTDTRLIASLLLLRREGAESGKRVVFRVSRCVQSWANVCRVEALLKGTA